jgi:hypothetical protein
MNKQKTTSKLSLKQAGIVCLEFVPIGDDIPVYISHLITHGYSSFLPYYDFERSFCTTDEDLFIHIKCMTEEAKLTLGRPWPLSLRTALEDRKNIFTSEFIEELCKKRDIENGMPVPQLPLAYPGELWRTEIDPCKFNMALARIRNKNAFDEQWAAVRNEQRRRLENEVKRHSTGLAGRYELGRREDRYKFFEVVMERNASSLGFEYDKVKSVKCRAIFTKKISDTWDLCWAIEEARQFYFSPMKGNFQLSLELRGRHVNGSLETAKPGTFLIIRFQNIIPGFLRSYWEFFDFDQLEVIIKAHLYLYSLVSPMIESGLHKTLGNDSWTR